MCIQCRLQPHVLKPMHVNVFHTGDILTKAPPPITSATARVIKGANIQHLYMYIFIHPLQVCFFTPPGSPLPAPPSPLRSLPPRACLPPPPRMPNAAPSLPRPALSLSLSLSLPREGAGSLEEAQGQVQGQGRIEGPSPSLPPAPPPPPAPPSAAVILNDGQGASVPAAIMDMRR